MPKYRITIEEVVERRSKLFSSVTDLRTVYQQEVNTLDVPNVIAAVNKEVSKDVD